MKAVYLSLFTLLVSLPFSSGARAEISDNQIDGCMIAGMLGGYAGAFKGSFSGRIPQEATKGAIIGCAAGLVLGSINNPASAKDVSSDRELNGGDPGEVSEQ